MKNDNFEQSHSAKKFERETLWDFQTSIMFQNIKKMKLGTLWYNQKSFEKSLIVQEKIQVKNTQIAKVGILRCFQGSGRRFYNFVWGVPRFAECFGRTEQMKKKLDLSCLKKLPTLRVGHVFN